MRRRLLAVALAGLMLAMGVNVYAGEAAAGEPGAEAAEAKAAKPTPVGAYLSNRAKDFLDIFNIKLGLGDGLSFLFHVRATRLLQIGAGRFAGTKVGFHGPSAGMFGEGRVEYGISVFYWAWIGRKTSKTGITEDAAKTNRFFGRVDDIKTAETYREFEDANRPWYTIGGAFALPFLPGIEMEMNPAEAVDFLISLFDIRGFRIPPPFYKVEVQGEKVPAPYSIRWHGQEDFEVYD